MKLSTAQLASEEMEPVNLKMPRSMVIEVDRAAGRLDPAAPNRSAWIRGVIYRALVRDRNASAADGVAR
jgi:hypothetical protein